MTPGGVREEQWEKTWNRVAEEESSEGQRCEQESGRGLQQDVKESGRATAQKAAECSATYVLIMALRAALRSRSANLSTR